MSQNGAITFSNSIFTNTMFLLFFFIGKYNFLPSRICKYRQWESLGHLRGNSKSVPAGEAMPALQMFKFTPLLPCGPRDFVVHCSSLTDN